MSEIDKNILQGDIEMICGVSGAFCLKCNNFGEYGKTMNMINTEKLGWINLCWDCIKKMERVNE